MKINKNAFEWKVSWTSSNDTFLNTFLNALSVSLRQGTVNLCHRFGKN